MVKSKNVVIEPQVLTFSDQARPLYYPHQGGQARSPYEMELTVCKVPVSLRRDIYSVFPEAENFMKTTPGRSLCVVITYQHSSVDLVGWTDGAAVEKDKLLENYMAFAYRFIEVLTDIVKSEEKENFALFADFTDPCSGLPILTQNTSAVYAEVDAIQALLKYPIDHVGSCTIVKHPKWGSFSYPASMLVSATPEQLQKAFDRIAISLDVNTPDTERVFHISKSQVIY